ncbi:methylmalonyl-CoA mutase, partial [bacterium]|nr:methylmalonyl-CoA mutase [bacterium]
MTTMSQRPTPEKWRLRVERELGPDRDFERSLVTRTLEGIDVQPLYTAEAAPEDAPAGAVSPRSGGWAIAQRIDHPAPKVANQHLLEDLAGGASGCLIERASGSGGVELEWLHDLDQVLDGVY